MNHIGLENQSGEDIAGIDWYDDLDGMSFLRRSGELGELRVIGGYLREGFSYMVTEPRLVGRVQAK